MPDLPDLDTRIRELVARAVADAPAPPQLDAARSTAVRADPDRRRWWIGGTAALLAAAAAVVTFVLVGNRTDTVTTPATEPTTAPTTEPTPLTSGPVTGRVVPQPRPAGLLTAGPEGVRERVGGTIRTVTTEPVVMALDTGDGRVIVQRRRGNGSGGPELWIDADTVPLVVGADGSLAPLFPELAWGGGVVLHDVEVVDGRRLLLYSVVGPVVSLQAYEDLWIVDLATGEPTRIAEDIGGWEFGTGRLHLASTGLIVGEGGSGATVFPSFFLVPGSAAEAAGVPDPEALGLTVQNTDCGECAHAFTISADGSQIGWIAPDRRDVVVVALDQGRPVGQPQRFGPAPEGPVADLELTTSAVVGSFAEEADGAVPAPVIVTREAGVTSLDGLAATLSPGAADGPVAPPTPTTIPATTTTTLADDVPAGVRLTTAGPDGVAVIDGGVEVRRLEQPAEIGLLTPGGAVIFQPARTAPDGHPGDPQIWRPDGTVAPFLGPQAADQWYRLHDVASIDGVPHLLYGLRTDGPAPEDHLEAVKVLALDPAGWTTTDITVVNTWEGGLSRLSLATDGTIIGTAHELVSTSFFAAVVPGSPADDGSVAGPPAGVEPAYGDCGDCPNDFTISADGESLVWTVGSDLVVADTTSGEQRTWTVASLVDQPVRSIDVRTSSDGGVEAAISFGWPGDTTGRTPVVVATSPPGDVVETGVGGRVVTFGP